MAANLHLYADISQAILSVPSDGPFAVTNARTPGVATPQIGVDPDERVRGDADHGPPDVKGAVVAFIHQPSSRRTLGAGATFAACVLVAACGSAPETSVPDSTSPAAAGGTTSSPVTTRDPAPADRTPGAVTLTPSARRSTQTLTAALPVTSIVDPGNGPRVAVIRAPSGNIICDFSVDGSHGGCGVLSMINPDAGTKWWIDISGATPRRILRQDAPWSGNTDGSVQVVQYGTTVVTGSFACRSETSGLTCWNTKTGKGAHLARTGITVVTMPVGDIPVRGAGSPPTPAGTTGDDAVYAALLSAPVPAKLVPNNRAGRLRNGVYADFDPEIPGEKVWLKNGADDTEWKSRVSFVDVAGDDRRETVVLLGRTNGGVPWPDGIVVYDQSLRIIWSWDTGNAGGDPRGNARFRRAGATSVEVEIPGTGRSAGGANQSGTSTYRLSKGAATPNWTLVSRR